MCNGEWCRCPSRWGIVLRASNDSEPLSRFGEAGALFLCSSAGWIVAIGRDREEGSFAVAGGACAWPVHATSSIVPSRRPVTVDDDLILGDADGHDL
jgi:hypothetical protein